MPQSRSCMRYAGEDLVYNYKHPATIRHRTSSNRYRHPALRTACPVAAAYRPP